MKTTAPRQLHGFVPRQRRDRLIALRAGLCRGVFMTPQAVASTSRNPAGDF
jgi:hypothetical protein